jgi:2-polyprenyl-6-methoxyphenol hydroxylase-like FAD-dependent oxidoreductase
MNRATTGDSSHAVVIGGSIAGLLAARVLSDHYQQVTIIERETLAQSAAPRQAIPQGRHVHVLLHKGIQIVQSLFPDLLQALIDSGLELADTSRDFRWRHFGVWKARIPTGLDILFLNRPLFEWFVASRVSKIPGVSVLDRCEVTGLQVTPDRRRVTGLAVRPANASERQFAADLVVDASGRGSQTPLWLKSLGLPAPEETIVEVNVGYASRIYRRPADLADKTALFVQPRPPNTRGAAVFPIDGNRWLVTLAGWLADYPPTTDNEFLEFAGSLEVPDVRLALEQAEPLTPISIHKFSANRRRHYEKLGRLPEGLIVMGDALCSFNPVYAQGMTVAALGAMMLDQCLRWGHGHTDSQTSSLARRFYRQMSDIVDASWQAAVGEDLRYPEVIGRRPPGTRLTHWYTALIHQATAHDEYVAGEFYKVLHLTAPPSLLFRPGVLVRTLGAAFRRKASPVSDASPSLDIVSDAH